MPEPSGGRHPRPEHGATLIELLVAIAIMGLAFVIIVGGIATAILGSETQKEHAATDVALRTAAETISYLPCPEAGIAGYQAQVPAVTDMTVAVTKVSYWNSDENKFLEGACADTGLQLIELRASPTSGKTRCKVGNDLSGCPPLQIVKRRP